VTQRMMTLPLGNLLDRVADEYARNDAVRSVLAATWCEHRHAAPAVHLRLLPQPCAPVTGMLSA
jgi:hypothetical protein